MIYRERLVVADSIVKNFEPNQTEKLSNTFYLFLGCRKIFTAKKKVRSMTNIPLPKSVPFVHNARAKL